MEWLLLHTGEQLPVHLKCTAVLAFIQRYIELKLTLAYSSRLTLVLYRRRTSKPIWNDVNCTFKKCWRSLAIRWNDTWLANKESFKAKRYVREHDILRESTLGKLLL